MSGYSYVRHLRAGCFTCHGDHAHWFDKNAQGVAARHHQATGHPTWVEVNMTIYYGDRKAEDVPPPLAR